MRVTRNAFLLLVKHGRVDMPVYLYLLLMPSKMMVNGYKL